MEVGTESPRKPAWLKVRLPGGENYLRLRGMARRLALHTVCEESLCPNVAECWGRGTLTFMILGNVCTRACAFCAVGAGRPTEYDLNEPERVATAVREMGVKYAVITSVARDDLMDGGALMFAKTIQRIRERSPGTLIEVLIPDLGGNREALRTIWEARPDVLAHNLETVRRLQGSVRSKANYERSLWVLSETARETKIRTKTGLQLGHGESHEEILETIDDLVRAGVRILTLGQYLQPTRFHRPVARFVPPEEFAVLREEALRRGIRYCFAGPLVRSSYHAEEVFQELPASSGGGPSFSKGGERDASVCSSLRLLHQGGRAAQGKIEQL